MIKKRTCLYWYVLPSKQDNFKKNENSVYLKINSKQRFSLKYNTNKVLISIEIKS